MFDYLKAEAYHKLRREILNAVDRALAEDIYYRYSAYHSGRKSAFSDVLDLMNSVDNELNEEMEHEAEKEAAYYGAEVAADESHSKQI